MSSTTLCRVGERYSPPPSGHQTMVPSVQCEIQLKIFGNSAIRTCNWQRATNVGQWASGRSIRLMRPLPATGISIYFYVSFALSRRKLKRNLDTISMPQCLPLPTSFPPLPVQPPPLPPHTINLNSGHQFSRRLQAARGAS